MSAANRGEFVPYDDPGIADFTDAFGEEAQAILELSPLTRARVQDGEGYSILTKEPLALPNEYALVPDTDEPAVAHAGVFGFEALIPAGKRRPAEIPSFGLAEVVLKTLHIKVDRTKRHTVEVERRIALGVKESDSDSGDKRYVMVDLSAGTSTSVKIPHYPEDGEPGTERTVSGRARNRKEFVRSLDDIGRTYDRIRSAIAAGVSLEDRRRFEPATSGA